MSSSDLIRPLSCGVCVKSIQPGGVERVRALNPEFQIPLPPTRSPLLPPAVGTTSLEAVGTAVWPLRALLACLHDLPRAGARHQPGAAAEASLHDM